MDEDPVELPELDVGHVSAEGEGSSVPHHNITLRICNTKKSSKKMSSVLKRKTSMDALEYRASQFKPLRPK